MYTTNNPLIYRKGQIWQSDDGYHCSWLNDIGEGNPYQAMTAVGWTPLASIDEAKSAIDEAVNTATIVAGLHDWMNIKDALAHGKPGDLVRHFNSWTGYDTLTLIWAHPSKLYGIFSDGSVTSTIDNIGVTSQSQIGAVDIPALIARYAQATLRQPTLCDCGHESLHPMTTSSGTSCPDCYDRMSE